MRRLIFVGICVLGFSSCSSRSVKVLDGTWTSMKNQMPPTSSTRLQKVGPVDVEYCMSSWSGSYGLMDEVVKKAESTHNIDYVKYPSFSQVLGTGCMQLTGEGYRVVQ